MVLRQIVRRARAGALFALAGMLVGSAASAQQGAILSGVGPVNRSMGGASVAAPIDASGAIHWNPASISGLPGSELEFGVELLIPTTRLSSTVRAGSLGGGFPPVTLSGADDTDAGAFAIPTFGLVYKPECSPWTYGIGIFGTAGFGVNYPANSSNPIVSPPPPAGLGLGSIFSEFQVLQIAPTASYQLTDHLSVGFAPTINMARLMVDPFFVAAPDDANGDGFFTYPDGTHTRYHAGAGYQIGVYYTTDCCWNFGASYKSTQWFETFEYNSSDELGRPRELKFELDYPAIVSLGVSYTGFDRLLLAADVRYFDFANTEGFDDSGFGPNGAVRGVGWDSIVAVALGAQYQCNDCLTLRVGYTWNENPIGDDQSIFNVASPTILEHTIYLGASIRVTDCWELSLAYVHGFENSIDGPIKSAAGTIPGSSVKSETSADAFVIGTTVKF